jgi:hypothetical protein
MKYFVYFIFIIIGQKAYGQINVNCTGQAGMLSCASVNAQSVTSSSRFVDDHVGGQRSTSEIVINNSNSDIVHLQALSSSPYGLVSIFTSNAGHFANYQIDIGGRIDGSILMNADDVNLIGDVFGTLSIDVSGYKGAQGLSSSDLCLRKVTSGFYGVAANDDLIRQYVSSNSTSSCDVNLQKVLSDNAPPTFCPFGYKYLPELDNSQAQVFTVNRRRFMQKCSATIVQSESPLVTSVDYRYKSQGAACDSGYVDEGLTQDYPFADSGESVICGVGSCPNANMKISFQTTYGTDLTREPGQSGSYGGKANVFAYDISQLSIDYANGANGSIGVQNVSQVPVTKYCLRIVDNTSPELPLPSPERNSPAVNLHAVTFYPMHIQDPTSLPDTLFPPRSSAEEVGVFKKIDSSARDFIYRNLIRLSP